MIDLESYADPYAYFDFLKSDIVGQKVKLNTSQYQRLEEEYKQSTRLLLALEVKSEVTAQYGAASGSLSMTARTEYEVQTSFSQSKEDITHTITEQDLDLPSGSIHGTVVGKVDVQAGGYRFTIPLFHFPQIWTASNFKFFNGKSGTQALQLAMDSVGSEYRANGTHRNVRIPPPNGKTCHHVKFREAHPDNCHPDGSNCVELAGDSFVVCHHHDFKWIGGPNCNCTHIDGSNVIIKPASQLWAEPFSQAV